MYVTRPRSLYKFSPDAISQAPPEGPNSGYLVIDPGSKAIKELPLPHNKIIGATDDNGEYTISLHVLFIPVINLPLSSNRYYMILAEGDHQGLAYVSSTEEDTRTKCCCTYIEAKKPRRLNPFDIHQQFEVILTGSARKCFKAKSVAPDGVVTSLLGGAWDVYLPSSSKIQIPELSDEAPGLNSALRSCLPSFDFPLSRERTPPVVVGKWVCPFMFIREGKPKDRMKKTPFYEMTLEQRWERVFACENTDGASSVAVNAVVPTEVVMVNGKDAVTERDEAQGVVWFWTVDDRMEHTKVGLSLVIIERMIWEEERVGWEKGNEKQVMIGKVETFIGGGNVCSSWRRYGCYVLVERFVLKRMDGSLVLTYEFKHTHQTKCKWE